MTKSEIRLEIKNKLSQNANNLESFSNQICEKIISLPEYRTSQIILAYSPLQDEVNISSVIKQALQDGKKIYLPKIEKDSSTMNFFEYKKNEHLEKGCFGILEPEAKNQFNKNESSQVLVLVPGRAFTKDGKRLGRGKGFYDKFFQNCSKNIILIGVCYPVQIVETLPVTQNDVPVSKVIF